MRTTLILTLLIVCASADAVSGVEPLKSGLQPGEKITTIFEPVNVTGPYAGELHCLVCENGANPVAMVFARRPSDALWKLMAQLDAATGKHEREQMGSFVVFLNNEVDLAETLTKGARQRSLEKIILSIDDPAGPSGFKVAKESDITVVLYRDHEVVANHAFRKGELSDAAIGKVLADLPKLVSGE